MNLAAVDAETARFLSEAMATWRAQLAEGVRRMQAGGHLDPQANPDHLAAAVLAAIQGGLVLSQPEGDGWPLKAALDQLLHSLRAYEQAHAGSV